MEKLLFSNQIEDEDWFYKTYKLSDFDEIPTKQGIYSWHAYIRQPHEDEVNDYNNFHKIENLKGEVKGNFNLKYTVKLQSQKEKLSSSSRSFDFLKFSSILFAPPIYIGISYQDINNRLNQHKKLLLKFNNSGSYENAFEKIESDSEEESSDFGVRLAQKLDRYSRLKPNDFFVKVMFKKAAIRNEELENIEYILNRTFKPIHGRK